MEIAPDGTRKKVLRYVNLGDVTKKDARDALATKLVTANSGTGPIRSRVTFRTLASQWEASVVPMYKHSTQKHRRSTLKCHLLPRFGDRPLCDLTRQEIQAYVAQLAHDGYAPKSVDHVHDVLSAILRTAVKWGHLQDNPARGVDLPTLKGVRMKWALTRSQATALIGELALLPRTMVGLAILSGLRRGELFALRWRSIDEQPGWLAVREAVYDGVFDTPKTEAGSRQPPLSRAVVNLLAEWRQHVGSTTPDALVFATRVGTPIEPANILRRHVFPACDRLGLPRATWLTFRRTYSSWSRDTGVPAKVVAQLMGHANVDTTLNIYTQVLDGALRDAVERVGGGLFTLVHKPEENESGSAA